MTKTASTPGVVSARVVREEPSKIHCGSADPVKGDVVLLYELTGGKKCASFRPEVFPNARIELSFRGDIYYGRQTDPSSWSSSRPLFARNIYVYQGPIELRPHVPTRFPFALNFPDHCDDETAAALPPSMVKLQRGLYAHAHASVHVAYSVALHVHITGQQVKHLSDSALSTNIYYEPARVPLSHVRFRTTRMVEAFEVPVPAPPRKPLSLLRSSAAACPTSHFAMTITASDVPTHLYLESPLAFNLSVEHHNADYRHLEVEIAGLTVSLISRTRVRGGWVPDTEKALELVGSASPPGPFADCSADTSDNASDNSDPDAAEARRNNGWTKRVNVLRPLTGISSGFAFDAPSSNQQGGQRGEPLLERNYMLQIECSLSVARKMMQFRSRIAVEVHPPMEVELDAHRAVSFSSEMDAVELDDLPPTPPDYSSMLEELPSYEEAMALVGAPVRAAL